MTNDDQQRLAELTSQRQEVLAHQERLQEELREVPARLHLIAVRERLLREAMPQVVSGAEPGPTEREHLGLPTRRQQRLAALRTSPASEPKIEAPAGETTGVCQFEVSTSLV